MKADAFNWKEGQRIVRDNTKELGTVAKSAAHTLKVTWDSGQTTYYWLNDVSGVHLEEQQLG